MSIQQVSNALERLKEYPDVVNYIKYFNEPGGFMFMEEVSEEQKNLYIKMSQLLDNDGMHSGASWSYLLRMVQGVLNGVFTLEELKIKEEEALRGCAAGKASPTTPDRAALPLN